MVYKRVRVKHRMKYEVLIVRKMFLNEPETARRKKSFIYFIRDMGVLATKEGWRVTGLACVAGGICVRVLYCFLRRSNPCASRQLRRLRQITGRSNSTYCGNDSWVQTFSQPDKLITFVSSAFSLNDKSQTIIAN